MERKEIELLPRPAEHKNLTSSSCLGSSAKRVFAYVPRIHVLQNLGMAGGYVYILTNRPNGVLHVGVTNDLVRRMFEHRSGFVEGFTRRYGSKRLVYFETFDDIRDAIQRERRHSNVRLQSHS